MIETSEAALSAWGDAQRGARRRRTRMRRRASLIAIAIAGLLETIVAPPSPRLVWNASASAPVGLYLVTGTERIGRGEMVVAALPSAWRDLAVQRHYLPAGVPLVKRIAAVAGDRICALSDTVTVERRVVARRLLTDGEGRPMPWWRGCRTLRDGGVLLLMADKTSSFDGRYFGPSRASDLLGRATLLWAR